MRYKLLGNSGLRVSEICLGTMSFGDNWGFGADRAESLRIAAAYAERGGNFLDTANKYHDGQTEEFVADIINEDRDRWVVGTKYTLAMVSGDPNAAGNSRKNMMRSVEASLKRLRTDYIDLLWVHAWDFTTSPHEVMRGLDDLVRMGKVNYVGISDAPAWVVSQCNTIAELRGWSPFVGLQIRYSLIERDVERELLPMANAMGLGVTIWAPLGAGLLTGKYTRGDGDVSDAKRADSARANLTERNKKIAQTVDAIADELKASSAQVAVRWTQHQGHNIIPLVGARKLSQIEDTLGALDVSLKAEHLSRLDEVSKINLGFPHEFLDNETVVELVYGDVEGRIERPTLRGGNDKL